MRPLEARGRQAGCRGDDKRYLADRMKSLYLTEIVLLDYNIGLLASSFRYVFALISEGFFKGLRCEENISAIKHETIKKTRFQSPNENEGRAQNH